MLAGEVMDRAAVLLNDRAKSIYTYTAQIPHLNTAIDEMLEAMEQNNVPATNKTSTAIVVTAGVIEVGFNTIPQLPLDLIEIQELWERLNGTTDDFMQMSRREFLPPFQQQTAYLQYWAWQEQKLKFIGSTSDIQLRLDYIRRVQVPIVDENTQIDLINAKSYLYYRTAALCADFIGENESRASSLNTNAGYALDRFLSIPTKGRQSIPKRRKPFMAAYKARFIG